MKNLPPHPLATHPSDPGASETQRGRLSPGGPSESCPDSSVGTVRFGGRVRNVLPHVCSHRVHCLGHSAEGLPSAPEQVAKGFLRVVVLSGFTSLSLGNSGTQRGLASPRVSSAALNAGAVPALAHLFREALHCSKTGQKHRAEPRNRTPCLQIQGHSCKCKPGSQALTPKHCPENHQALA